MMTEYTKKVCIYCNRNYLRNKLQGDWEKGEKLARGYHPKIINYYYCDYCKLTCTSIKTKKVN